MFGVSFVLFFLFSFFIFSVFCFAGVVSCGGGVEEKEEFTSPGIFRRSTRSIAAIAWFVSHH